MKGAMLTINADYNRLPDKQASDVVFVLDPMVATAGTATAALKMVEDSGVPSQFNPILGESSFF